MSQLETTLRRAIADLDPADRDGRRIALGNVRAAMLRLLAVYDPPLSADAIETKIDEVDGLIRAIEAEFAPPRPAPQPVAPAPVFEPATEPRLAESDFEEEYEAGEEDHVDDAFDEGPFDDEESFEEPDFPDQDADDDARDDGAPAAAGLGSGRTLALVGGGLVLLLVLLIGALYLAGPQQFGGQSTADAQMAAGTPAVADPDAPAAAGGTDALEVTDVAPEAIPGAPPADPAPAAPPTETATAPEAAATDSAPAATTPAATTPAAETPAVAAPASVPPESVAPPIGPAAAESLVLFDGHDPSGFKSAPDNPVEFEGGTDGGSVRIASSATSNGARLVVGPGVYQQIAGKTVRVVVVARGARDNPASALRLAYQNGHQLSGWSDLKLGDAYQSLAMSWAVPKQRSGGEGDAVLIEPGIPGDGTAADIRSVTIDILD